MTSSVILTGQAIRFSAFRLLALTADLIQDIGQETAETNLRILRVAGPAPNKKHASAILNIQGDL